jgi:hypothetical protein
MASSVAIANISSHNSMGNGFSPTALLLIRLSGFLHRCFSEITDWIILSARVVGMMTSVRGKGAYHHLNATLVTGTRLK